MSRVKPNSITKLPIFATKHARRTASSLGHTLENRHPPSPENRTTLQRTFSSHSTSTKELSVGLQQTRPSTWYRHHVPFRIQTHRGGFIHRRSSWLLSSISMRRIETLASSRRQSCRLRVRGANFCVWTE